MRREFSWLLLTVVLGCSDGAPPGSGGVCVEEETRACGTAIGVCKEGTQSCVDGRWSDCIGTTLGGDEVCDDKDNDCDGNIDEGDGPCGGACAMSGKPGDACDGVDSDLCDDDHYVCDGLNAVVCSVGDDDEEICNQKDDDCDDEVDEGDTFKNNDNGCGGICELDGPPDDPCDGPDSDLCPDDLYECDGTNEVVCTEGDDDEEECDGEDDDCDGVIDNGFGELPGTPCDGDDSDVCRDDEYVCDPDGDVTVCLGDGVLTNEPGVSCDGDDADSCADDAYECRDGEADTVCVDVPSCEETGECPAEWVVGENGSFSVGGVALGEDGGAFVAGGEAGDATVTAYTTSAEVLWQTSLGSGVGRDVAVSSDDSVYVTGSLGSNAFVAKLDAETGDMVWTVPTAGGTAVANGVVALAAGGGVVAGTFEGELSIGGETLSVLSSDENATGVFTAQVDADGVLVWARRLLQGNPAGTGEARDIAVDAEGNLYIAGVYERMVRLGDDDSSQETIAVGKQDLFVVKTSSDGVMEWARGNGGAEDDTLGAIGVSSDGRVRMVGTWGVDGESTTITFGGGEPNETTLTLDCCNDTSDIFLAGFAVDGALEWAEKLGSADPQDTSERGNAIAVAADGSFAITGTYSDETDFDPGEGQFMAPNPCCDATNNSAFVARYNADGEFVALAYAWAQEYGNAQEGYATALGCDDSVRVAGLGTASPDGNMWLAKVQPNSISDSCDDVIEISGVTGTYAENTSGSPGGPGCDIGGANPPEKIFRWEAPEDGTVTFSTCQGAEWNTVLSASVGSCGGSQVGCNDDSCGSQSSIDFDVTAGTVYFIYVGGFASDSGSFTLSWIMNCGTGAAVISGSAGQIESTTVGQPSGPGCDFGSDTPHERSFAWTAPDSGKVTFSTCGEGATPPSFDMAISCSTDRCEASTGCGEITGCPERAICDDGGVSLTFDAVSGTTYFVHVTGINNESGSFTLRWFMGFSDVIELVPPEGGTIEALTTVNRPGGPGCPLQQSDNPAEQAFSWEAPSDTIVTFSTCGAATFDSTLTVHEGSADGPTLFCPMPATCEDGGSSVTISAVSGTTYFITVGGRNFESGEFSLQWFMGCGEDTVTEIFGATGTSAHSTVNQPGGPGCDIGENNPSEWRFAWTSPSESGNVTFSACDSATFDAVLTRFGDSGSACSSPACGDLDNRCEISFAYSADTIYYLTVGGISHSSGSFTLSW